MNGKTRCHCFVLMQNAFKFAKLQTTLFARSYRVTDGAFRQNHGIINVFGFMNVISPVKGTQVFFFKFKSAIAAVGIVSSCVRKQSFRTSSIMQIIVSFWSFDYFVGVLRYTV